MSLVSLLFYFFEIVAAVSAISLIFVRQLFHAALLLVVCLLAIAGIYVLTFAEFLAVTQILIYAGGILIVIVFGIMLTAKISGKPLRVENQYWFSGLVIGFFFFSLFVKLFLSEVFSGEKNIESTSDTFQSVGIALMSDYVLPFEVAGILLLMALVGAAVTASFNKPKKI